MTKSSFVGRGEIPIVGDLLIHSTRRARPSTALYFATLLHMGGTWKSKIMLKERKGFINW